MTRRRSLPLDSDAYEATDEGGFARGGVAPSSTGGFRYDGRGLKAAEFTNFVAGYNFGTILPDFVVLHHTYGPCTLAARTNTWLWDDNETGLSEQQIYDKRARQLASIRDEYQRKDPPWDSGPHLFIDDRYVWLFTPMYYPGTHAMSGNLYYDAQGRLHYSIGIEVVGCYKEVRWPAPVAHLVGHAVAVLKDRLGTFALEYKPGPPNLPQYHVNSISSHRDYNKPECPGAAITTDFYLGVLSEGWQEYKNAGHPVEPPADITTATPLLGPASGRVEQVIAFVQAHLPVGSEYTNDLERIFGYYWTYGVPAGIDPFLAATQCVFETDSLRSWWASKPQRNPAGLGVHEEGGLSFPSWDSSVQAHLGQLLAYCLRDNQANATQLSLMQQNPRHNRIPAAVRGTCRTLGDLGGRWTANPAYGKNLANRARAILGLPPLP